MSAQHPITPPPELVEQWRTAPEYATGLQKLWMVSMTTHRLQEIATQAAQWGANQELEACCQALRVRGTRMRCMEANQTIEHLRAARRPRPPSLKEQALMALEDGDLGPGAHLTPTEVCIIRRALESLDD